jgi:hypothetical protein
VSGADNITGIACETTTDHCLAVGDSGSDVGVFARVDGAIPEAAQPEAGTTGLAGVSCFEESCLAVGSSSGGGVVVKLKLS